MLHSALAAHISTSFARASQSQISHNPRENRPFSRLQQRWHTRCVTPFVRTQIGLILSLALLCFQAQAGGKPQATEFPFQYLEGLIWLKVQTPKSAEPLNFLLDSGAGISVINLTTAQRLGLRLANRVEVQGVGSSTYGYFPQRLSASV